MRALAAVAAILAAAAEVPQEPFAHPGCLHGREDLARIRERVAKGDEPWKAGFEALRDHPQSRKDWKRRGPFETVVRGPRENRRIAELEQDANAAYQNALMGAVTGDEGHWRKAAEIVDAWAGTLREISGHDKELAASLCGFKLVNAAELLRHAWGGWARESAARFERMAREVLYPVIREFATFANGNWDTGCVKAMMAIGVFCDDREIFDRAAAYFRGGKGNGRLTHYVVNEAGQGQESGRDQQHAQLGMGHLAEACEIAWKQGLDLYGESGNRLLRGFEYLARYNLGEEVPFEPHTDVTGKYRAARVSEEGRGRLRPIYEMVWNHYEGRRGLAAPWTRRAADQLRPEGAAFGADHPGFGTLLWTLAPPR